MNKVTHIARKIIFGIIGFPLVIIGIILIPLPGPGLLISFAGLFVLSLEFEWAKPWTMRVQKELRGIMQKSKAGSNKAVDRKADRPQADHQ